MPPVLVSVASLLEGWLYHTKLRSAKGKNAPLEPVGQIPDSIRNSWDHTWPFSWVPNLVTKCQPVPVAWLHVAKRLQKWDAP